MHMDSDNLRYYNVAGLNISIQGGGDCADAFRDYFRKEEIQNPCEPISLSIILTNRPEEVEIPAKFYSLSGKIAFNDSEYRVKKDNCVYSVSNLFSATEPIVLRLCYTGKKSLKHAIGIMLLHNVGIISGKDEFMESVMNYAVFWYIFAVILMKHKKLFVHSSMLENDGSAIVLAGTGGCGKTSTLLKFVEKEGGRYLAEDFGIMASDGYVYYTPKRMAIYQSDAKYRNPAVVQALKKLPLWQRIRWKMLILIGANPIFRFAPEQVFDVTKIVHKSKIGTVIFLSRVHGTEISKVEISKLELCTKIRHATFRELAELGEILNNIRAVGDENTRKCYPEIRELEKEYEQILSNILLDKNIGMLEVPLKAVPKDIVNHILDKY